MPLPHPRLTNTLIGHDDAERTLLEAYNSGALPHAWLITGTQGIGKATLAYRFAKFILTNGILDTTPETSLFGDALPTIKPTSLDVPDNCPAAIRIASEGHGDVMVIEPTNKTEDGKETTNWEIRIWQARKLSNFLRHSSAETGWHIVIIDPVNEMSNEAANAILKLLEEPPKNTVILLISHHAGRLLPTIRSRCRVLNLRPLPLAHMRPILAQIYPATPVPKAESFDLLNDISSPPSQTLNEDMEFAITLANGSPGLAASLYTHHGLTLYHDMLTMMRELPTINPLIIHDFSNQFSKKDTHDHWHLFTTMFCWLISSTVRMGLGQPPPPFFTPEEHTIRLRLLTHCGIENLAEIWEKTNQLTHTGEGLHMDRQHTTLEMMKLLVG